MSNNQDENLDFQGKSFLLMIWKKNKFIVTGAFVLTIVLIFAFMYPRESQKSPKALLSYMGVSSQVKVCADSESDNRDDMYFVYGFENEVEDQFGWRSEYPLIDYANGNHETDGSETQGTYSTLADEIISACDELYDENKTFASNLDKYLEQKNQEALERDRIAAESKAKIQPLLDKWNEKATQAGGGDIIDYVAAESSAESQIKSGASYSFTGASAEISSVSCYATELSSWIGGNPGGWWSCMIQTLGGSFDVYSIQFSGSSWGGKPDNGRMAGRDLNWTIPDELLEWIRSSG